MHSITHLDRVRAAIRSSWPTGIVCPPLVVRFRAGSERAGWGTLVELARIRGEHPEDLVVERLTQTVSADLVVESETREAAETGRFLVLGTLGALEEAGASPGAVASETERSV